MVHANGPKALVGAGGATADATVAAKLVDEVAKADPWAMIDKIKNAINTTTRDLSAGDRTAGELATGGGAASVDAKTNADLAAAVALKAMTKTGKFSLNSADVSGAASSAVNKVLGVLNEIIRKTVVINLERVREAVKKIQYSEATGETIKADTAQTTTSK